MQRPLQFSNLIKNHLARTSCPAFEIASLFKTASNLFITAYLGREGALHMEALFTKVLFLNDFLIASQRKIAHLCLLLFLTQIFIQCYTIYHFYFLNFEQEKNIKVCKSELFFLSCLWSKLLGVTNIKQFLICIWCHAINVHSTNLYVGIKQYGF